MPKKKKTEEKNILKKKLRKKEKITSEEEREKESGEEPLNVTIDLSEESPLEEIAEQPEISETETAEFSEFMIPETSASDMPTLTLPSSSPSLAEPTENLESAASSIATSPTTISNQPFQQDYEAKVYNQPGYEGATSYKLRENEIRTLTKQHIAERPIMPETPVIQRWADERIQQVRDEDWSRPEKELRDYVLESLSKKETKKRKILD